jgi:hypothetical protein
MPDDATSRPLAVFQSEPAALYELIVVSFIVNARAVATRVSSADPCVSYNELVVVVPWM